VIVRAASQAHLEWLVNRIGLCPRADIRGIVAVDQRERVRGGVLYEGWTQSSVQVHMASEAPIVWRHLLRPAMRYPFVDCGKSVLVASIAESNVASWRLASHFGFSLVGRIRDGRALRDDLLIAELRRDACRWL